MGRLKIFTLTLILFSAVSEAISQQTVVTGQGVPTQPATNYDYHDAFGPIFYSKNGNDIRSASGQPGPKYWQNRADYKLSVRLNEQTNEISGTEILTYTNNRPDKMSFIWMQLDQD